jgi:hypothetical protein
VKHEGIGQKNPGKSYSLKCSNPGKGEYFGNQINNSKKTKKYAYTAVNCSGRTSALPYPFHDVKINRIEL